MSTTFLVEPLPLAEETVGQRITELRHRLKPTQGKKVTQTELARRVGVHPGTVAAWEIDKQRPDGERLVKLAAALGTTPEFILRGERAAAEEFEPEPSEAEAAASDILATFDAAARFLNGMGAPGQATARKLAAIELYERTAAAWGFRMPDWWYTLADRVRRGEL